MTIQRVEQYDSSTDPYIAETYHPCDKVIHKISTTDPERGISEVMTYRVIDKDTLERRTTRTIYQLGNPSTIQDPPLRLIGNAINKHNIIVSVDAHGKPLKRIIWKKD